MAAAVLAAGVASTAVFALTEEPTAAPAASLLVRRSGKPAASLSGAVVEPASRSLSELGITRANYPALTEAMRTATRTGRPTMTAPLRLEAGGANVAVLAPMYRADVPATSAAQRDAAATGWTGVIFAGDEPGGRVGTVAGAEVIAGAGALFSLLAAALIWALGGAKNRALRLVRDRTEELTRSEQRFRSLATASPLGVFSLTADGACEYANERLCELTGRSEEQLHGRGLVGAFHPDDVGALRKAVTAGNGRASSLRLRMVLPDGSLRWVKTHAAPLHDAREALRGWAGSVEDVTAEVQAQIATQQMSAQLAHQARHDPLTGLPNRSFFAEQISELLADDPGTGVSVVFLDVDRFKVVNDSLGHAAGDRLLVILAERLRAAVRPGDLPARLAGDEFVVGLTGVRDPDQAMFEAQRLLSTLNQTMIIDGREISVTVSIGVAVGTQGMDAATLVGQADTAMYQAKSHGKARVELFAGFQPGRAGSTLELEHELRNAIDTGQLRLRYQPIASVATGAIVGVESLVRWQHPDRGLVGPGDFIPLAEDSGLIVPLGTWVLREACAQIDRWRPLLGDGRAFSVTVNVSPRQLADPLFPSVVAAAVHDHRVDPASLCLEITESALLHDVARAEEALGSLRRIGVRVAVDDFGTGYSSLSHLRLLPIDILKIDQSFVRELGVNADSTAIVGAVIRLAGALGLACVAEGVEQRDQLNWLSSMGCEMAQGYFLAMPEPAETVTSLLAAGSVDATDVGTLEPVSEV